MSEPQHYESASARLEEIIRRLDSGEAGLRETLELCQEGRRLVEFCAGELDAVAQGLEAAGMDGTRRLIAGEVKFNHLVCMAQVGRSCHGAGWHSGCCSGANRASA